MKPTAENFFRASDEAMLYFEDYGSGRPIVLLHGFLGSTQCFRKNIQGLSAHNRLILVDWRGHGLSSKTLSNLNMPRCADDIAELMDHLKLEDAVIIGWSIGSSVVMSYWQRYGARRLGGIGIVDSPLYPFSSEPWNCMPFRDFNMDLLVRGVEDMACRHDAYCRAFARSLFQREPGPEELEWLCGEIKKTPPWIAAALRSDFVGRDYLGTLTEITLPILICCADSPILPTGIEMGRHYRELLRGKCAFHPFPEAGHMMFYDDPEGFNRVILDFVNGVSS